MRILVIGASGFIGPPLVRQLRTQRLEIAALHRGAHPTPGGAIPIVGDRNRLIEAREAIAKFAPDVVIDLILSSQRQSIDLLLTLRGLRTRIVAASSIDVYLAISIFHGLETGPLQQVPLAEDSELRARPPYPPEALRRLRKIMPWVDDDYDKVAVERALRSATELRSTILRLPMIYGPGDQLHRLYPTLKRMDDHRPAILLADEIAQWCGPRGYVDNVAAAIALAAVDERAAGQTYNVSTLSVSELEWMRMIAVQAGWNGDIVVLPRKQMPKDLRTAGNYAQHWTASSQRIRAELGYTEPVPVEESLRRTIQWERAHPPEIDPGQFDYAAEDAALARGMTCPPTN
jgi:nucleoside-diphosphate-sugar epimerase